MQVTQSPGLVVVEEQSTQFWIVEQAEQPLPVGKYPELQAVHRPPT